MERTTAEALFVELVSLLVSAGSPWLLQGQGRGSGELSVKPRGLEHSFRLCPLAQAEWLQKTAAEIKQFGVDESASMDGRSVLGSGRPWKRRTTPRKPQEITGILECQKVKGSALLDLTYQWLVDKPYNIAGGPAGKLAKRIAAVSAPPTAASGFQVGASADWKGVPWRHCGSS